MHHSETTPDDAIDEAQLVWRNITESTLRHKVYSVSLRDPNIMQSASCWRPVNRQYRRPRPPHSLFAVISHRFILEQPIRDLKNNAFCLFTARPARVNKLTHCACVIHTNNVLWVILELVPFVTDVTNWPFRRYKKLNLAREKRCELKNSFHFRETLSFLKI